VVVERDGSFALDEDRPLTIGRVHSFYGNFGVLVRAYTYLLALGIVPLSSLWLRFEVIQLAYALIGAFFMPMLAITLFLLNNRVQWVGRTYRNGFVINALLILTLLFFTSKLFLP